MLNQLKKSSHLKAVLIISVGLVSGCQETPSGNGLRVPPSSATHAQGIIEGVQDEPGEYGLGSLTIAELMERFEVPGVSVAVIDNFDIHWAKGYGISDVETGMVVDTATMFQAASISKPVAAMATVRAAQDGLFSLDDDINDILRSWSLDGGGFTDERPVTPRGLTSHTSGLGDGFGFPGYAPGVPLPTTVQILEGHELSNVGPVFMEREPVSYTHLTLPTIYSV